MATVGQSDAYLLRQVLRFDSRDRLNAFLVALQAVVDRHDILRTGFIWQGLAEPVQVVFREAVVPVEEVVLGDGPGTVDRLLAAAVSSLDVGRAPLLSARIAAESGGDWLLLLQGHHLVQDHTTVDVLVLEVQAFLDGQEERLPAPLPFREFVAQARLGMPRSAHEEFFEQLLGDVTETTAPFGLVDVRGDGENIAEASASLDRELSLRIREQARRLGVSPAAVFHVVWSRVLAVLSSRDDVVFGTVLFGRMHSGAGADRVPGLFINTLPLRMRMSGKGVAEAVREMQNELADLPSMNTLHWPWPNRPVACPLWHRCSRLFSTTGTRRC